MPLVLNLSSVFRERLGDDVADELVNVLNTFDAGYRTELRQLNDANFGRLDARLDERFVAVDRRFDDIDKRFADIDKRFADIDKRFADIDKRFADVNSAMSGLRVDLADGLAALRVELADREVRLQRWFIGTWITTVIGFAGLAVAVLGRR